jgi:peptidoglycan hydrolase CwlO-like protein
MMLSRRGGSVRPSFVMSLRQRMHQKTMEETIKRLEAEKVAIEAANEALRVTASAANAAKDAAEAAAASAASGSSVGGGGGVPTDAAKALAKDTSGAGP